MKDEWIIRLLLAIIFGLIAFSVHREISRVDTGVKVLHQRVNDANRLKTDKEDV